MLGFLIASLMNTLRPHFALSKTRLATLSVLLVGLANCRTVNLSHLASQFPGAALYASNYRRLQRFELLKKDFEVMQANVNSTLNEMRAEGAKREVPQNASGFGQLKQRAGGDTFPVWRMQHSIPWR